MIPDDRPDGWADSTLAQFIEAMWSNTLATYDQLPGLRLKLEQVDRLFNTFMSGLLNPENQLGALLLIRSISAFRIGTAISMVAPTDCYPILRSCLEYAGYAHLIASNPHLGPVWLNRDIDDRSLAACRSAFSTRAVKDALASADPGTKAIFDELYERSIMFGAHPNEKGLSGSLRVSMDEHSGDRRIDVVLLPEGGLPTELAMKTAAQIGICPLRIFGLVLPRRFRDSNLMPDLNEASRDL